MLRLGLWTLIDRCLTRSPTPENSIFPVVGPPCFLKSLRLRCIQLLLSPEAGGDLGKFLEPLRKVEGGVETEEGCDFTDRQIRFTQEALDPFEAELSMILLRAESGILFEHASEIGVSNF